MALEPDGEPVFDYTIAREVEKQEHEERPTVVFMLPTEEEAGTAFFLPVRVERYKAKRAAMNHANAAHIRVELDETLAPQPVDVGSLEAAGAAASGDEGAHSNHEDNEHISVDA
jgi:hypothetical protein